MVRFRASLRVSRIRVRVKDRARVSVIRWTAYRWHGYNSSHLSHHGTYTKHSIGL